MLVAEGDAPAAAVLAGPGGPADRHGEGDGAAQAGAAADQEEEEGDADATCDALIFIIFKTGRDHELDSRML